MAAKNKPHISFSELMDWELCPHFHWKKHIEKVVPKKDDEYSCFGTAVHESVERLILDEFINRDSFEFDEEKYRKIFLDTLKKEVKASFERGDEINFARLEEMRAGFLKTLPKVIPYFRKEFGDYSVVETELVLYEEIEGHDKKFKGYVDIVLVLDDGTPVVVDLKTTKSGWHPRFKNDKRKVYQLVYYNKFTGDKLDWEDGHRAARFVLFKWGGKGGLQSVEVSLGKKRTKNALVLLDEGLTMIGRGLHPKDRTACRKHYGGCCPLFNTKHCPRGY